MQSQQKSVATKGKHIFIGQQIRIITQRERTSDRFWNQWWRWPLSSRFQLLPSNWSVPWHPKLMATIRHHDNLGSLASVSRPRKAVSQHSLDLALTARSSTCQACNRSMWHNLTFLPHFPQPRCLHSTPLYLGIYTYKRTRIDLEMA